MILSKVRSLQALILSALFVLSAAPGAHADQSPIGWLDQVTPDYRLVGWTLDRDSPEQSLDAHFYVDGSGGRGVIVGAVVANLPRPHVNKVTGYPGDHGFSFAIPEQYRSGYRFFYAYGIDSTGDPNAELSGSPKTNDITPPTASITSPLGGTTASGTLTIGANASDDVGVLGVQFKLDGVNLGAELTTAPYAAGSSFLQAAIQQPYYDYGPSIIQDGALYKMYWCHWLEVGPGDAIWYASSSDGQNWGNIQMVLRTTPNSEETAFQPDGHVCDPSVVKVGSIYYLYYTAAALGGTNNQIFLATSHDGVNWTKYPSNANPQPVIRNNVKSGGYGIGQSVVLYLNAKFYHYFTDTDRGGEMLAYSVDGVNWTVQNNNRPVFSDFGFIPVYLSDLKVFFAALASNTHTNDGIYYSFSLDGLNWSPKSRNAAYKLPVGGNRGSAHNGGILTDAVGRVRGSSLLFYYGAGGAAIDGNWDANSWDIDVTRIDFQPPQGVIEPYAVSWDTTTVVNGSHALSAVARDAAGNITTSAAVVVIVDNRDITPPTVSITSPLNGATVWQTITVSAVASDDIALAGVQWKLDGVNLGAEQTTSPYSISWNTTTVANGIHTLTAVARDSSDNTATSSAVTVTVSNDATPPVISWVGASNISSSSATITWTTNEPAYCQVEFGPTTAYGSVTPYGTAPMTAHTHVLSGLALGTLYHYRVWSRDAHGNVAVSGDFTFTTSAPAADLVAYRAITPITVDGVLEEWTGVSAVQFSGLSNGVTGYLAWDATNLYVAFRVTDTKLSALQTTRDSGNLWRDDSVEVYVDTRNDRASAIQPDDYQFLVNLHNVQVDLRGTGSGKDLAWNATWASAVSRQGTLNSHGDTDSRYTVEIAIPWAQVGVTPTAGMYLGLDLVVDDSDPTSTTAYETFDWARIAPNSYAQPKLWKQVRLEDPVALTRAATPITADGVLDEWTRASTVQFSGLSNGATGYLAWDATHLYVAFKVTDAQLSALQTTRDSSNLWRDDSVEVYIDTRNDRASAMQPDDYQFSVNLNNVQLDLRGTGTGKDLAWNATWASAASRQGTLNSHGDTDSGYIVEMAIPWTQLGVTPTSGLVVGVDLSVMDSDPARATTFDYFDWARIAPAYFAQPYRWKPVQLVDAVPTPP